MGALKELIVRDSRQGVQGFANAMRLQAPKKLRPKHRQVVMLAELGFSQKEIAATVGYTESRVSVVLNWRSPEIDEYRESARRQVLDKTLEVGDRIALSANEMLDVMLFHARRKEADPTNSRIAARDILHMAGYSPVKKTVNANLNAQVPAELQAAVNQLDKLMEVESKQDQWAVREPERLKDGTNG